MKKLFGFLVVFSIFALFLNGNNLVGAESWVDSTSVKFNLQKTDTSLPTNTRNNNVDCNEQLIPITEPKTFLGLISIGSIDKVKVCGNDTKYGFYGNNYLQYNGNTAGELKLGAGRAYPLTANNLENIIISNPNSLNPGNFLYFATTLDIRFQKTETFTVPSKYKYNYLTPDLSTAKRIFGTKNENIFIMDDTASFSSNGKWLVFDANNYGHIRLNTEDGSILSFGVPFSYGQGFTPNYKTAISPDGRFAIFASGGSIMVYDLSSCLDVVNSSLKRCSSRNLEPIRQQQQPYGSQINNVRFVSDKEFTYYVGASSGGRTVYNKYRVTIGDIPEHGYQYLGLGDSFASGEGVYNYRSLTDSVDNKCHNSLSSYAYLIGAETNLAQYNSVTCSGAKIEDVYLSRILTESYEGQYGNNIKQRERSVDDILQIENSFTPGKITQSTFVNDLDPEKITLSVGGNDVGFGEIITNCVIGAFANQTCLNEFSERMLVLGQISAQVPRLKEVYENLKSGDRKVYVTGYPKIVKPGGDCSLNVQLNSAEVDFADKLTETLNDAIETATKQAGVFYVDVENAFAGHRLCETDYINTYVHGLTIGDDKGIPSAEFLSDTVRFKGVKFIASESFHPNASGHQALKTVILNATNNLTASMPSPDPGASFTLPPEGSPYWGVLKSDGKTLFYPKYSDFIYGRVNVSENIRINLSRPTFTPGSLVKVMIHSDPVNVGTYSADAVGNFDQIIKIPNALEPGFHTIHLQGKDIFGHDIDAYDYVMVSKYLDDFDGDGILDENEGCVFMPKFGSDTDKDGLDDACDPVNNPVVEVPIPPTDQNNPPVNPPTDNSSNNGSGNSGSSNTAPLPSDPPEVIDNNGGSTNPLPEITPGGNTPPDPKPKDNNETVAGNEQTVEPPTQQTTNNSQVALSEVQNGSIATGTRLAVNQNEVEVLESSQSNVLGDNQANTQSNADIDLAEPTLAVQTATKQSVQLYKRVGFYYVVIGILVLLFLIILGLRRRTGQRQI